MNRRQKLILNTSSSFLKQIIVTICGFIVPRFMLLYYGSSINGLVSSITQFLGFITLLEMGIGPVIQANLYGPLAEKDEEHISKVIVSSERFFRKIAYIFLIYIAILAYIYPKYINNDYDTFFTVSLLVIIAISTFAQYYFGMSYQLLLNADQKSYIQMFIQIGTVLLNTISTVVLIKLGASISIVQLFTTVIYAFRPVLQLIYVKKHYNINKHVQIVDEPIKQKWNGFSQHVAAVICSNADVVVLSLFSSMENVSVYSVYYMITNGVTSTIISAATGLESYFGNMIAQNEHKNLLKAFEIIEWLIHVSVTIIFTVAAISIVPFVSVYTRGVIDADYNVPVFGLLLVISYAVQCLRIPYFRIIKAAGHFKETQSGAFISAILNVIISIALVFEYGLIGIALGTLVAMLYHTCYFVWYLRKQLLKRSVIYFIGYVIMDMLICIIVMLLTKNIQMENITYISWILYALKVSLIAIGVAFVFNLIFYYKKIKNVVLLLRK